MSNIEKKQINNLIEISKQLRIDVVNIIHGAKSGHIGGSLGLADIFTALYFHVLNHNSNDPNWKDRDRFVVSNGHVAPIYYTALAHSGYFPVSELSSLRKLRSRLQGHPNSLELPGVEISTGSLGQGLGVACGMALIAQKDKEDHLVYCSIGDGETQEGSIWEAAMFAGHRELSNLIAFTDRNYIQIDGNTEEINKLEPLAEKWKAFNWNVLSANGNDMEEILNVFEKAKKENSKPTMIIFNTKLGFPVSFMDGVSKWHGTAPNDEEAKSAIKEIEEYYLKLNL